jgi:hypothetical protein
VEENLPILAALRDLPCNELSSSDSSWLEVMVIEPSRCGQPINLLPPLGGGQYSCSSEEQRLLIVMSADELVENSGPSTAS